MRSPFRVDARPLVFMALTVALVLPARAAAQTTPVSNPTTLVFTPSADHNAVLADGSPAVDHYTFDVYSVGAAQPFQSTDIGKPAPASDGSIYYNFSSMVASWPLPGGTYESRVAAVGPNGSGVSSASNPFTFSSCAYALSGTSASLPAAGGGTQVSLTTGSGCAWTATTDSAWIALSAASGSGSATIVATVAANASTTARVGTITIGGQAFTVSQAGAACSFALSSSSQSFPATGGNGSVGVTTTSGCAWTAASGASWVAVSPASGSSSGTVSYTVGANSGAARSATLTIAGNAYAVSQAGIAAPSAPASPSPASGATGVSTSPTLTWTASGAASYVIRFGTSNPPPQAASGLAAASYSPGTLASATVYYWQVVATNVSASTTGPVWSFTTAAAPAPAGVPSPWQSQDVGTTGLAGSATFASGVFTVAGSGSDVGGTADAFQLVSQPAGSQTTIVARLTGQQNVNASAKAGVMMRSGASANAASAMVAVLPDGSVEFIVRSKAGGTSTMTQAGAQAAPAWMRLVRSSKTVTASVSADGTTWRTVGSARMSLGGTPLLGLAVTSHDTSQRDSATFDTVSVK